MAIPNPHDDNPNNPETAGELWVGDSASNVEVIDLKTQSVVASISTGGVARADELAYDPLDHIVLIANDRETTCVMGMWTGAIYNIHLGGESNGGGPNFLSKCRFRRNTI